MAVALAARRGRAWPARTHGLALHPVFHHEGRECLGVGAVRGDETASVADRAHALDRFAGGTAFLQLVTCARDLGPSDAQSSPHEVHPHAPFLQTGLPQKQLGGSPGQLPVVPSERVVPSLLPPSPMGPEIAPPHATRDRSKVVSKRMSHALLSCPSLDRARSRRKVPTTSEASVLFCQV